MSYQSWSVVFSEQPSAAKWNILGTNDSTFNTLLGTYGVKNPYCFRAYASGGTTIADAADTKVLFATEEYDYNSNFASSTYTAPVNGVYHFDGKVAFNTSIASGVLAYALIYVNGSIAFSGVAQSGGYTTAAAFTISGDVYVGAGQAVELWMYQDSGGTEATQPAQVNTWFSGHLVHAV